MLQTNFSRMIMTILALLCISGCTSVKTGREKTSPALILPQPKELELLGETWDLRDCAIVIGSAATEPEKYAAGMLSKNIEKRFGLKLAVIDETENLSNYSGLIVLGTNQSNQLLNQISRKNNIKLTETSPGSDDFVIKMLNYQGKQIVLIAGSNRRGVTYGQFAFSQLPKSVGQKISFPTVLVRDWSSIPWRGRNYFDYRHLLEDGVLDAYARARLNWIDVRGEPPWQMHSYSGFSPDYNFSEKEIRQMKEVITQAHRRGMFVYGTIRSGVKDTQAIADVMSMSKKLIDIGVDGLWFSFDDAGPGEYPLEVIKQGIALAGRHDITGRAIAIVPPHGSYQLIDTPFNHQAAAVEGMEKTTWFFTRPPCSDDAELSRRIGLEVLPAWWYNWPRTETGFARKGYEGFSMVEGYRPYRQIPQLFEGWGRRHKVNWGHEFSDWKEFQVGYEDLRDADKNINTFTFWCADYGDEYLVTIAGFWCWNPKSFDHQQVSRYIYSTVFGKPLIETARQFDSKLKSLKKLYAPFDVDTKFDPVKNPRRLKNEKDKPEAEQLIASMSALLDKLKQQAPKFSLLSTERLKEYYLDPMTIELNMAKISLK